MQNFDVHKILKDNLLNTISDKGYANLLLFDTETTGISLPIYITQIGYILIKITQIDGKLIFTEISEKEKDYYPTEKKIEPYASFVTNMIREEDIKDTVYIKELEKVWKEKKKKFNVSELIVLKKELGEFDLKDLTIITDKSGIEYEIDFYSGHNLYEYDFKSVLTNTYNWEPNPGTIFDTLYYNMYAKKVNGDRLSKTKQGRNLNNTVSGIIEKIKDKDELAEIEKLMKEREEIAHSALLDIKVNLIATKYHIQKIVEENYNIIEIENNNERAYAKNDILYLETNMSKNNIITINEVVNFASEKEVKTIILVDRYWSNNAKHQEIINKAGLEVIFGLRVYNIDEKEDYDILISGTIAYRNIISIVKDFQTVTNKNLKDISEYTTCVVLPSNKMVKPKYKTKSDREAYYLLSSSLNNEVLTKQEKDLFVGKDEDLSLETGLFTSDVKQKWLRDQMAVKSFETIDFYFYEKLELSAFPPLTVLSNNITENPKTIDGYIDELEKLIDEIFYQNKGKNNLEKVLKTTIFTKKDYEDRIKEEIYVLKTTGNSDYVKYFFLMYKNRLIVEEEINKGFLSREDIYGKEESLKIEAYGPGRGSAAGSLIAFILGITDTNPLKYDLLFERFINPERVSMPDIDVDIQDKELYYNILSKYYNEKMPHEMDYSEKPYDIYDEYIIEEYIKPSRDFIGKISALAYTTKKTILANIVRLYALPYFIQTSVSREFIEDDISLIENVDNMSVREEIYNLVNEEVLEKLDEYGNKGNKVFANYGLHAAGVIFYPYHAAVMTPTLSGNVTIWDGNYIEAMFLVKMDYLGLATKAALDEIRKKVFEQYGEKALFQNNDMELDDPLTLNAMAEGKTSMTFQMESNSARRILGKLAPLVFEDIIAANALNRPGPLSSGAVDDYISASIEEKRKKYNFRYIKYEDFSKRDKKDQLDIIEKIRLRMSENYIKIDNETIITGLYKGKNSSLTDKEKNLYYINSKQLVKMSKDGIEKIIGDYQEFHIGFDEMLLSDKVITNLITNESYFQSKNFNQKIKDIYDSLDYEDEETELYKYIKENKIKNGFELNNYIIKDTDFLNKLGYPELEIDYESIFKKINENKEKVPELTKKLESLSEFDIFKYFLNSENNIEDSYMEILNIKKDIQAYFEKLNQAVINIEYTSALPIYKKIKEEYLEDNINYESFKSKILELENNIKSHPIYAQLTAGTYKTIVYQEQIMRLSTNQAGYTKGQSDNLRKAIAKQKKDMMDVHKKMLIEGLTTYSGDLRYLNEYNMLIVKDNKDGTILITNINTNNITQIAGSVNTEGEIIIDDSLGEAQKEHLKAMNSKKAPLLDIITAFYLWEKIEKFGAYAFNKSHAASYSIIAYETQFYKEKFPLIAYSTLLSYVPEKNKQTLLAEIKNTGMKISLQSINENLNVDYQYDDKENEILLPISHVKSLGKKDLFSIIPLIKNYKVQSILDLIILLNTVPKKVLETFGVLGMFKNDVISQTEWHYSTEYDLQAKEEDKKHVPLIVKNILEKAFKSPSFKSVYKDFYKDLNVPDEYKDLYVFATDTKLLTDFYMFSYYQEQFKLDNDNVETGGENYMQDYIKLQKSVLVKINKLKVSAEFKEEITNHIVEGNYNFFEDYEFYQTLVTYRINKTNEIKELLKEEVLKQKIENNLKEIVLQGMKKEKNYNYNLDKEYLDLPYIIKQALYESKLKEGNPFIAVPDYKNADMVPYISLDPFEERENSHNDTKEFRKMMNIAENINEDGRYINIAIITDYMPKCNASQKYSTEGDNRRMTMKEHFNLLFSTIPEEERKYINPIWISLFEDIKDVAEDMENDRSIYNSEYVEERIEATFEKMLKANIHHIILAMPKKAILREKIVKQQYKTFQNVNDSKYISYRLKNGATFLNQLVTFIDPIFPYYSLNKELYIKRGQDLLNSLNVEVDLLNFLVEKEKRG